MRIIFDGEKALHEYIKILSSAKRSIWMCMYKIEFDDCTKKLWQVIDDKYRSYVDVSVWYDAFGSLKSMPRLLSYPYCKLYLPKWYKLMTRNHAKVFMVDEKICVVSGRNLTKKYFYEWNDASIILDDDNSLKAIKDFKIRIEQRRNTKLSYWNDFCITDPLSGTKTVYNFVLEHIVKAKKAITILSPYFVIDEALEALLLAAADRGVKITIIVPHKPEHRLASTFNRINFQRIHHPNVIVMRSQGMFHTKAMIFDEVALVGSANFDNRSFKHNTELSVVVGKKHIVAIKEHAKKVAHTSLNYHWIQRAYDQVLFAFTRHLMELL